MRFMKRIYILIFGISVVSLSCKKNIDLYPLNNVAVDNFYKNASEVQTALSGCYAGLRNTLLEEWQMTELRSDNAIMGNASSTSVPNREKSDIDLFIPSTSLTAIYSYWSANYTNIRNINLVLNSLALDYDSTTGKLVKNTSSVTITESEYKELAAQATFLRAYHYFNLVRLFGGVFLIHEPFIGSQALDAININRSSVASIYNLILADLEYASANGVNLNYTTFAASNSGNNLGKVNAWSAKALLAKVLLTLNRKTEASTLLTDIITNSGYGLITTGITPYADIFSVNNEMNREILFAVRYKAGGLGIGSPWPNTFAPELSGTAVVNGDGDGFNIGSIELENSYATADTRKAFTLGIWSTGTNRRLYAKKHITPVTLLDDAENDWPVIRFADVILMQAEAKGFSPESIALINQTRARAGLSASPLTAINVPTAQRFADSLAMERRLEFAFENVRWFDMLRFKTTLPEISEDAVTRIKSHYAYMYTSHYGRYPSPIPSLSVIQGNVTTNKLLLPIPQREIDNNSKLVIPQNPGY
ncbi:MAG: RagB/SusD family nutrient uptake outer membrane protein [Sediminibacterium sp.]|nr:RagB/SusD family nutrient uptake outer membrane protein [Sediminibacterium sp.]